MREKFSRYAPPVIALVMAVLCCCAFAFYFNPMEDVSLDLSLVPQEDGMVQDPDDFDPKGWTVFVQEGDVRTERIPSGFGGYSGLELGQTFYLSRLMDEELDSPTLQLDPIEWNFSIWLDDVLIYTDCPELDNRIGYLRLPVNDWYRDNPITISLPADYYGKTLTIAQSTWNWTETGRVMAWPTSIRLYCGYAYESGLISETFRVFLMAMLSLMLTLVLLTTFVRRRDFSILCLALVSFYWMWQHLIGTSFYYKYAALTENTLGNFPPLAATLALLVFLTLRGGCKQKAIWVPVGVFALSIPVHVAVYVLNPVFSSWYSVNGILTDFVPYWLASIAFVLLMVMGAVRWRKENWFYRIFIPLSFAGIALSWTAEIAFRNQLVWEQIVGNLASGQVLYLFTPVVQSGNEMLDIILNGKMSPAADAGIRVEIPHINAPASLTLSDPDLCGLIMNIVDNAITAASAAAEPYILIKIHERDGFLGIVCENTFAPQVLEAEAKKETVPKHGLGLKIVKGIVAKYSGVITEKYDGDLFTIKIVIPL